MGDQLLPANVRTRPETPLAAGRAILNIAMTSPFGHAQFEAPAAAIAGFLRRTYQIVPTGQESGYMDFDDELSELLSQA
jgi:hypothetical protein